jgi:hypothetical protein
MEMAKDRKDIYIVDQNRRDRSRLREREREIETEWEDTNR